MKTKIKIGAILAFLAILAYANLETNINTIGISLGYAVLIMIPLSLIMWKYKAKLNEVPKGVVGLIIAGSLFAWHWLASKSFMAEITLAFAFTLLGIAIAFLIDEKDVKL